MRSTFLRLVETLAQPRLRTAFVALGLLLFAAIWLLQLSHASLTPPSDNIEQLTWVHALQWGYYKHPPLPTWMLWLPVRLFGATAWTTYATTATLTMAAMLLFWRLLRSLRGAPYANLALLAALCITYYNVRLYYYNHNTVLLVFSTAAAALSWKAWCSRQRRWWAALGLVLGLGLLTKYQVAVTMSCVLVFWLSRRGWRDARQREGLLLAGLVALLVFSPHLEWLRTHDFGPVHYAMESSLDADMGLGNRLFYSVNWLADQLLNRALPAWLLLMAALPGWWRGARSSPQTATPPTPSTLVDGAASRALLLSWGLVPLVFMPLTCIVTGSGLQMPWGTSFLLFAVPAAMEIAYPRLRPMRIAWRSAWFAFGLIQAGLLLLNQLSSPLGPAALQDHHWRAFDSRRLAAQLAPLARAAAAAAPICVISGPSKIAGSLALEYPGHPLVLIDGRLDRSPWLDAQTLRHCSVLELGQGNLAPGAQWVGPAFPDLWWRVASGAAVAQSFKH